MYVCERCCILVLLAVTLNGASGWDVWDGYDGWNDFGYGEYLNIKFRRATATSIVIEFICKLRCNDDISWKIRGADERRWRPVNSMYVHRVHNRFQILGLQSGRLYYIKGYSGHASATVVAETCPVRPDGVSDLRHEVSGPGWLDIRWNPPQRMYCRADYEYLTRYKVGDGSFTSYRSYGFYAVGRGHLHIGPSHPCSLWPKEFCLLLTEKVVAGKNHTVEITVKRLNGSSSEVHMPQTIIVFADPKNKEGYSDGGINPECIVWTYVLSGSSAFATFIILALIISSVLHAKKKVERAEREEAEPSTTTDEVENTQPQQTH